MYLQCRKYIPPYPAHICAITNIRTLETYLLPSRPIRYLTITLESSNLVARIQLRSCCTFYLPLTSAPPSPGQAGFSQLFPLVQSCQMTAATAGVGCQIDKGAVPPTRRFRFEVSLSVEGRQLPGDIYRLLHKPVKFTSSPGCSSMWAHIQYKVIVFPSIDVLKK